MTEFDWDHLTGQEEKLGSKAPAPLLAKDSARCEKSYFQEKRYIRKPVLQFPLLGKAGISSWIQAARSEVNPCFLPLPKRQSQRYTNHNPRANCYRELKGKSLWKSHQPSDPLKSTWTGNAAPLWAFAHLPISLCLFFWGGKCQRHLCWVCLLGSHYRKAVI